jgi:uncharacterized protein involved in response to NO
METERNFAAMPGPTWRAEPFRLFFPLGVVLSWAGVGHWLLYSTGVTSTYSCELHGFIQTQGFMMAFAAGFLLTAVPRRTQTPPVSTSEMLALATALITTTLAAWREDWVVAQLSYLATFAILLQFALRRFLGRAAGRRPPAAFVLIPIGVLHGIGGAVAIILGSTERADLWFIDFGKLLVEQGVFLCFVVGIGSLILPLMSGEPPPADLGSSPRENRKAIAYAVAGAFIFVSLLLEQLGWDRGGPILRATVIAVGLAFGAGAWRRPGKPGLHRRLVWISIWMIPFGLAASAISPDYRVAALHILFIIGFGLLAFGVATHVSFGHLDMEEVGFGRPPAVIMLALMFFLAMLGRLAADASETYFEHLGWAASFWLIGTLTWLCYFGPRLLRTTR